MTLPDAGAAAAQWVYLPWDSEHFGFPIASLSPRTIGESALVTAVASASDAGIRCLYWLADQTPTNTDAARETGFTLVSARMVFERLLPGNFGHTANQPDVRVAVDADLDGLRALASSSHRNSRFYADSTFPRDRSDALYAAWVDRSHHDANQRLLVMGPASDPIAYVACELDETNHVGTIGLVAVSQQHRGEGFGSVLLNDALKWLAGEGATSVVVVTQGDNVAAHNLYRTLGFTVIDVAVWFHRWF